MYRRLGVLILLAMPGLTFAASKEIQELQRDVALLQDQVKQLQQSQDKQLAAITALVQQAIDSAGRAGTQAAVIQSNVQQNLQDMQSKVVPPVVGLGSRIDSMGNDFRTLQQAVSDLTNSLQKVQAQLTDLTNMVKVLQAPPAPPPAAPGVGPGQGAAAPEVPPVSASDLFANARRDQTSGKLDLALQEYSDYLRYFGNTDLAPSAQYYIGSIHLSQGDYPTAVKDFDTVLEKYSDNDRTPLALYYKGQSLAKMSRRTDAAAEYKELIQRFPNHSLATQACTQLKDMGLRCPGAAPAHPAAKSKKKS
jgi:TolA-binding protein